MKKIFFFLMIGIAITSCSEDSSLFDPTYFGEGYKGITFTTEAGPEAIKSDPTDWCTRESGGGGGISITEGFSFGPAYPNPVSFDQSTRLGFSLPVQTHVLIYIKNSHKETIAYLANQSYSAGVYEFSIDVGRLGGKGVFRIFFESENFICKGDIWVR